MDYRWFQEPVIFSLFHFKTKSPAYYFPLYLPYPIKDVKKKFHLRKTTETISQKKVKGVISVMTKLLFVSSSKNK